MGNTSLVVQAKDGSSLGNIVEPVRLQKGSGKVTLTRSFVVPDTPEVRVFIPLYTGTEETLIVDSRIYNIAKKK